MNKLDVLRGKVLARKDESVMVYGGNASLIHLMELIVKTRLGIVV